MQDKQLKLIHLVILLCLSVFAFSTHSTAQEKDGLLKIYFLDVGQGDAIFIEAPNGNQVLIDGGPDNKVLSELANIMPFYEPGMKEMVVKNSTGDQIEIQARKAGMVTMLEDGFVKAAKGITSLEEILRVITE